MSISYAKRTFINVKDFGAIGDGTTNDSAAIQSAINSGETVFFPYGTYLCNNLTISNPSQLIGNGTLKLPNSADYPILNISAATTINGLIFDGNRANAGVADTYLIRASSTLNLNDCEFKNNVGGVRLATAPRSSIQNLKCLDFTQGQITVKDGSSFTTINNLVAYDAGNATVSLHIVDFEATSSELTGCLLTNSNINVNCTACQLTGSFVTNCLISNNFFQNNDNTGNGNCVKLDSVGTGNSIEGNRIHFANYGVFELGVNSSTISDNIFTQNPLAIGTRTAIRLGSSNIVVKKNIIQGAATDGISLGSNVDNCIISQNVISQCGRDGINSESATSNNNQIIDNDIDRSIRYGIRVDGASNFIKDNSIRNGSGVYGSYIAGSNSVLLDNYLEGNAANYIRFQGVTGCTVRAVSSSHVNNLAAGNFFSVVSPLFGAGSPESVLTAPIGSIYGRLDGGTSTTLYIKESGTGNTGWVAK